MLHKVMIAALLMLLGSPSIAQISESLDVYIADGCSCCGEWAKHMQKNGFQVRRHSVTQEQLSRIRSGAGIAAKYASCHTAKVSGYVVEGHVPADDVKRLLREKPKAIGLSVPGMPIGSPGMEVGDQKEPYDVLLLQNDGTAQVYAKR
jgi:hypothetical protein